MYTALLLLLLALAPTCCHCLNNSSIELAYNEISQESENYQNLGKIGTFAGSVFGSVAGGAASQYVLPVKKDSGSLEKFGRGIGGATIFYTGLTAGKEAGEQAAKQLTASYYARKYGVSRTVAHAALIDGAPLSVPLIKELFVAADKHDKEQLRLLLTSYFGPKLSANGRLKTNNYSLLYTLSKLYFKRPVTKIDPMMVQLHLAEQLLHDVFEK